ncbi:MAG TPA: energy transducer TonB, partial [Chitinophagaceae bacterium]|nr:energy transducer TonB [Chitinophagaceae bacterium]
VVDTDGNISDLKIVQTARPDLDAEVLRVIKKMPQWKPGMQNGRKVPVFCKLPVTFVSAE